MLHGWTKEEYEEERKKMRAAFPTLDAAIHEIMMLRSVTSEAYQAVGMFSEDRPDGDESVIRALDNLAAASAGDPLPHKTMLMGPGGTFSDTD